MLPPTPSLCTSSPSASTRRSHRIPIPPSFSPFALYSHSCSPLAAGGRTALCWRWFYPGDDRDNKQLAERDAVAFAAGLAHTRATGADPAGRAMTRHCAPGPTGSCLSPTRMPFMRNAHSSSTCGSLLCRKCVAEWKWNRARVVRTA